MSEMDILCSKLDQVYDIDPSLYRKCVIHIFLHRPISEIKTMKFHEMRYTNDVCDIEKNILLSQFSTCRIKVCTTPEYYEDFVKKHPKYNLDNIHFAYDRISLNDECVIKLMTTCFNISYQPVPYKVLQYIKDNPHLYERFNNYYYLPEDEKSLELFGSLKIRSNEYTADFCQKWCSKNSKYFDMPNNSYQDILKYDRATMSGGYIICNNTTEIKTAVSMIGRAPSLQIGVSNLELLEVLENEFLHRNDIKEKIRTAECTYLWIRYMRDEKRREKAKRRLVLSYYIAYWSVSANYEYYEELESANVYNYFCSNHYCRNAMMYFASLDNKTSLNAAIVSASAEDLLYLKAQGINLGDIEKYVHLLE